VSQTLVALAYKDANGSFYLYHAFGLKRR